MTRKGISGPIPACLELLREGPSSIVWSVCSTRTIDICERRGLIRATGQQGRADLSLFELTESGHAALLPLAAAGAPALWDLPVR